MREHCQEIWKGFPEEVTLDLRAEGWIGVN